MRSYPLGWRATTVPGRCFRWRSASASAAPGCASSWPAASCCAGPGLRRFVLVALALGVAALAIDLVVLLGSPTRDDAGWLLFAALLVSTFLLAGTLGQPRPEKLHRL
jgi:hypothetical protein